MQIQTNQGMKLTGFYRGKVLKHCQMLASDSETGYGKCKVFIPGVYPDQYDDISMADKLPDAEQITPLFGGSHRGNGVYSYPNIGSIVICGFWNGDQNYPFFWGATLGGQECQQQYMHVNQKQGDPKCVKSGKDATIHKIRVKNTTVDIYENGKIDIDVVGETGGKCRVYIDGSGDVEIVAENRINIESSEIKLTAAQQLELHSPNILIDGTEKVDIESVGLINVNSVTGIEQTANHIGIQGYNEVNVGNVHPVPFK